MFLILSINCICTFANPFITPYASTMEWIYIQTKLALSIISCICQSSQQKNSVISTKGRYRPVPCRKCRHSKNYLRTCLDAPPLPSIICKLTRLLYGDIVLLVRWIFLNLSPTKYFWSFQWIAYAHLHIHSSHPTRLALLKRRFSRIIFAQIRYIHEVFYQFNAQFLPLPNRKNSDRILPGWNGLFFISVLLCTDFWYGHLSGSSWKNPERCWISSQEWDLCK